jgi:ABC-type multidrug transport system fused ATPase/permease subunit
MRQLNYLRSLTAFAFRENPLLWLAVLVSLGSVVLELAAMATLMPLAAAATGRPVDGASAPARLLSLIGIEPQGRQLMLLFIALFSVRIVSQFAGQMMIAHISRRLLAQLSTRAFDSLLNVVPIRDVERKSIGSYITLVGDESFRASTLVANLSQLVAQGGLAALYFAAIWIYSPSAAVAVMAFLLVAFLLMFEAFRASHRLGGVQVDQSQVAGSLFLDALNGLRSVKSFGAESFVAGSYRRMMADYVRTLFRIDALNMLTRLGPALILLLAAALFTVRPEWLGPQFSDFGFAVTLVIFLMRFFPVVGQTLSVALRVVADARAGRDVTELVAAGASIPAARDGRAVRAPAPVERIELSDVSLSHVPPRKALDSVSLSFERGRSYAIVGRSGSGKSTLMDLLLGFMSPDEGRVFVDGQPIVGNGAAALRGRVLLVSQETTIFNDTVRNNVRFGVSATDEDVDRACELAQVTEFVRNLPQGMDTLLSYRGTNLSGGQRQRIGIARAVLRQPSVLLLDESTSALDSDTRSRLVAALCAHWRERILVFVTHDPAVIAAVDCVVDMAVVNSAALEAQ